MQTALVYSPEFLLHRTEEGHPECPQRLEVIMDGLAEAGLLEEMLTLQFSAASLEILSMVHEPAYIELVRMACEEGFNFIGTSDTHICSASYEVARLASGGVIAACDSIMSNYVRSAFCPVRPPGHHAEVDQAMGFCLFNHVAIASEHLIRNHRLDRLAVVDLDVHHGNGTQHIFEKRSDVFYISLHERCDSGQFPGSGDESETGVAQGRGYTLNIPMRAGSGEVEYCQKMEEVVLPALGRYRPQFILLSMGFDTLSEDHMSFINLQPRSFDRLTRLIVNVANEHSDGRLLSVLEGGYDLPSLKKAVVYHVQALLGG